MSGLISSLKAALSTPRNDGTLHFSQHLQHDRHTVLYYEYGYPNVDSPWSNVFPLVQGTGVHNLVHEAMCNLTGMAQYTPEFAVKAPEEDFKYPWGGTVDAIMSYYGENWIIDYKTISGAGMSFLDGEVKPEHKLQVSAYKTFLPDMDFTTGILYLPSSPDYKRRWDEPVLMAFEPYTSKQIYARMHNVEAAIDSYVSTGALPDAPLGEYVWKKKYKYWQAVYKPHYTSMFCPWASLHDDPCGCSKATYKVIAEYKKGTLTIEEGYDTIVEEMGMPDEVL